MSWRTLHTSECESAKHLEAYKKHKGKEHTHLSQSGDQFTSKHLHHKIKLHMKDEFVDSS